MVAPSLCHAEVYEGTLRLERTGRLKQIRVSLAYRDGVITGLSHRLRTIVLSFPASDLRRR